MPYKYIGRTTNFKGKTLWEIIGNLKNYGIGRIVARSTFERYPEPCYYKIIKVQTLPNPEKPSLDDIRKVRVWVEKTFRGKTYPKQIQLESVSYKADYKLIPKDEESTYCKHVEQKVKILPKYMDFPPLLKELLVRESKNKEELPKLEIVYSKQPDKSKYRIAEDGEKPDVEIEIGLGPIASPNLYKNATL